MTEIQLEMQMIHFPSPRSHQERIEATIKHLEGAILSNNRIVLQTQVFPLVQHAAETEAPETLSTALKKYLEENSDEEGVVVFTRSL